MPRFLRACFVAFVSATVAHVAWVTAHEPFAFDAWNVAVDTDARPFSLGRFLAYWRFEYTHSNPRIGQALAYLSYKLEYFAVVATPLALLAISLAIVMLATGRWPWRRGRDLALWTIAIGAMWFALPQLGKMLFCRAYCANYVYSLVIQLWFLVPLRRIERASPGACVAYLVAGIIAGACNEHTGPTLCAFMVGYAWWLHRKTGVRPTFVGSGAAGTIIGFAAIFFAPGQAERYEGLAQRVSLLGRFLQRGITGNVEILRDLMLAAAPLLGLIAIVMIVALADPTPGDETRIARRGALRLVGIAMVASTVMAVTLFVSPKLGPRFFYASSCLLLAGMLAIVDNVLTTPRRLAPLVVLAVASSAYAAYHTVPLYGRLSHQSETRLTALEAARPGTVFIAESFEQVDETWWFLGDDFRDARKREMVTKYFGLVGLVFHAYDPLAPLGVSGARLVPHALLEPPGCLEGDLALGAVKGFDLAGIHREMKIAIELLRGRLGATRLDQLDLAVELDDPSVKLPRGAVLVGRWRPDRFEGYVAQILRKSRATTRDIALPKDLAPDFEIFVYQVGGELRRLGTARGEALQYVPWKTGVYWVLACRPAECFVVAATHQGG